MNRGYPDFLLAGVFGRGLGPGSVLGCVPRLPVVGLMDRIWTLLEFDFSVIVTSGYVLISPIGD